MGVKVMLLLAFVWTARGQQCKPKYQDGSRSLLFGGAAEPGRCISQCQSRDDYWGRTCQFQPGSTWGACTEEQRRNSFEIAKTLGNGDILKLTPCHVVNFLRGRTLWLIGDSHSKTMYRALQCFLIDHWDHTECETSPDGGAVQQLYNLPVSPGQSKCFHILGSGGGRVCMVHVVLGTSLVHNSQVASGGVLPLLREKFARKKDIFYINFGVWHKKSPEWYDELRPALEALGQYYKATKKEWPHMLFRETPAEHPKQGQACAAMIGYVFRPDTGKLEVNAAARVAIQGWSSGASLNKAARSILLSKYKMPVIPAFNMSVPLNDNHIGTAMNPELDCLHYCNPGVPETWIWYLWKAMKDGKTGIKQITNPKAAQMEAVRAPKYQCVPSRTMF